MRGESHWAQQAASELPDREDDFEPPAASPVPPSVPTCERCGDLEDAHAVPCRGVEEAPSAVQGEAPSYDPSRQAVVYLDELRDHERHLRRTHVRMQEAIQEQRWAALASFDNKFSIALSQVRAWLTPPAAAAPTPREPTPDATHWLFEDYEKAVRDEASETPSAFPAYDASLKRGVADARSKLRARLDFVESEVARLTRELEHERAEYRESIRMYIAENRNLNSVVRAAREISEGPHSEICKGRCAMCRALSSLPPTPTGEDTTNG